MQPDHSINTICPFCAYDSPSDYVNYNWQHFYQKHYIQFQSFQTNLKSLLASAESLYPEITNLECHFKRIQNLFLEIEFNRPSSISLFYVNLSNAMEWIVLGLLVKSEIGFSDNLGHLEELLKMVKISVNKPYFMYDFFEVKHKLKPHLLIHKNQKSFFDIEFAEIIIMHFRFIVLKSKEVINILERFKRNHGSLKINLPGCYHKTELCENYSKWGVCPLKEQCKYAHGETQLRRLICNNYLNGFCGEENCPYIHYLHN